jgi:hypothetical protein
VIAALYVETNGCYFGLPDVDPWDMKRDARLYDGPNSVVAHPPCARWSTLAHVNRARYGTPIGSDDGCFAAALASVRKFGGVLEHPRNSKAFAAFGLHAPVSGRWTLNAPGEWVTCVAQGNYGHRANKLTWLFVSGPRPAPLDWSPPPPPKAWIGGDPRLQVDVEHMCKKERLKTPEPFRELLLTIARNCARRSA